MQPSRSFVLRIAIYSLLLLYVAGDLLVFRGPLHRRLRSADPGSPESIAAAKARGQVARVFHHPILVSQLERAVAERLRREGREPGELGAAELRLVRYAVLNELIDHQLLRVKTKANALEVPVSEEEVDAELARFAARFTGEDELAAAMQSQGIGSRQELRMRLAGRLQQEKYLESRIGPPTRVGEEEAREWYDAQTAGMRRPERVRVRHVFLATLEREPAEARDTLAAALGRLQAGETDFTGLAAELSEDERSKGSGGELGWISRGRLAADFTAAVFALPDRVPSLVRTKLGWHLVEVLERRPAEAIPFEQAREEIVAALETDHRQQALAKFRRDLRKMERGNIDVFRDVIDAL